MLRVMISIIAVLAIVAAGCGVTQTPSTSPPAVPAEVLSVWESPPSPQGFPPDMIDELHLGKYGSSNYETSEADISNGLFLQNYEWIDIIVKSKNIPVRFYNREPGTVCFNVYLEYVWNCEDYEFWLDSEDLGTYYTGEVLPPKINPFAGRVLYGQPISQETRSGGDTIYSIAIRLFSEGGNCNGNLLGSECQIGFTNYDIYEEADISYEVYKLDTTPGWGYDREYWNNTLLPWIRQGETESEQEQRYNEWCEQFK